MIRAEELTKVYGDTIAVKGLDLHVGRGEAFGFVGPNGAGKTTTVNMLAGLIKPTRGRVYIDGELYVDENWMPTGASPLKAKIGYIPDTFGVYENLTVREYLYFFAAAYKLPAQEREPTVDDALDLTDLVPRADSMVAALSRGMQQRLAIARVLLHNPDLLLLDEPTSGLDPRARIEIRELLKELLRMGKTIFVSSHVLSELEDLCNRFGIIERGEMVFHGTLAELQAQIASGEMVRIRVAERTDEAAAALEAVPYVDGVDAADGTLTVHLSQPMTTPADLSALLFAKGFAITHYELLRPTLENVFMKLTKGLTQ